MASAQPQPSKRTTVPTYEEVMLPLLLLAKDGKEHPVSDALTPVADHFNLTQEARVESLPDGRNRLRHRIEWARTYLKKAGVLQYPKRGSFKITDRGIALLATNPKFVNAKLLMQYPEFIEFKQPAADSIVAIPDTPLPDVDPEEALENGYQAIRRNIEDDLLTRVKNASPAFFEDLVIDLLVKMGYGGSRREAARAIGKSGDGGIDGIINEDSLGLDVIYVQAKRWTGSPVGRPEIQKFVGALQGQRARKGIFLTTSTFSKEAYEYASKIDTKVILIDGYRLAALMFEHSVGVSETKAYRVKKIDSDYFED